VVYKGTYSNRPVAVKELSNSAAIDGFLEEAKMMMSLPSHPNVVQMIGIFCRIGMRYDGSLIALCSFFSQVLQCIRFVLSPN
jgi:hypothetical protein